MGQEVTPASGYEVSSSILAHEQLRAIFKQLGPAGGVAAAVRWMWSELERTPDEFGESREYLTYARLQVRVAFVGPLHVRFGVHQPSRQEFITHIGLANPRLWGGT